MTSLTGFEALLRGKKSAATACLLRRLGLTQDLLPIPRRSRRLELWQLIASTLIHYPDYIHPETHQAINAETAAQILIRQKNMQKNNNGLHRGYFAKKLGKIKQLYRSFK